MTGLKISTEKLGQGAFGTVYRGNSGTEVAVKEISLKRTTEESKKQIYTEILLHSRVHHQNIVQFMAVSRQPSSIFIVTQLVNGCNMEDWIFDDAHTKFS